ncbi:MFS transporter [Erythrobacter sp. AP23]|uniref:spinster family MFS transporter n=1 Tax=Erythrobacter sp. AP23 TaxID=499656 RepID=UPI00076C8E8C|nr:MFS transporter [Erythrobacter sp. AP23]KWV93780.1 hypothetical protein ASS64_12860 [Erythrobacter sp. AP23]
MHRNNATEMGPNTFTKHVDDRQANYILFVLFLTCTFNYADRQILAILMQPISETMQLSDTQLGLLSGLAFAIFYTTFGIPIARLADRGNRVRIIGCSVAAWSFMTALCGTAANFTQLLLYRIGVSIGEAGASPPAQAMIADYFPPSKRATAMAIFSLGMPAGLLVGYLVGGWVNQLFGWRAAFVAMGVPGLFLAALVFATVRDIPTRQGNAGSKIATLKPREVANIVFGASSIRYVIAGCSAASFVSYGVGQWIPTYLIRTYGMGTGEVGTWLALIIGSMAGAGIFLGGYISDRLGAIDKRWYVRFPAYALLLSVPFAVLFALAPSKGIALAALFPVTFLGYVYMGPALSIIQGIVPHNARATASAVLLLVTNLVGLGLGPLAIGILSDLMQPSVGTDSLRYALLAGLILYIVSAALLWRAGRSLREELVETD